MPTIQEVSPQPRTTLERLGDLYETMSPHPVAPYRRDALLSDGKIIALMRFDDANEIPAYRISSYVSDEPRPQFTADITTEGLSDFSLPSVGIYLFGVNVGVGNVHGLSKSDDFGLVGDKERQQVASDIVEWAEQSINLGTQTELDLQLIDTIQAPVVITSQRNEAAFENLIEEA